MCVCVSSKLFMEVCACLHESSRAVNTKQARGAQMESKRREDKGWCFSKMLCIFHLPVDT